MQIDPKDVYSVNWMSEKTYAAVSQVATQMTEHFIAAAHEPVKLALAANIAGLFRALIHAINFMSVVNGEIPVCTPDKLERSRQHVEFVSEQITYMTARLLDGVDPTHDHVVAIVRKEKPLDNRKTRKKA